MTYTSCQTNKCRKYVNLNADGFCPTCVEKQNKVSLDTTPYPCGRCRKNCEDTNSCVQCEICIEWFHVICVDISLTAYKELKSVPGFHWFCKGCDTKVPELIEKAKGLEADTKALQVDMVNVQKRLETVEKKLAGNVHVEIDTAISERTDIERRKMNLVVFNFPECDGDDENAWDLQTKINRDIDGISQLIQEELRIHIGEGADNVIVDAKRLGAKDKDSEQAKKGTPKPRPLKIVFKDIKKKRDVLTSAKNLRQSENTVANKVFISPDMTLAQRNKDKELRTLMWKRRTENNENVIIRKGEIIKVNWNVTKQRTFKPVAQPSKVPMEPVIPEGSTVQNKDD